MKIQSNLMFSPAAVWLFFILLENCNFAQASSRSSPPSIYPVNNLESSLAASAGQASVVAVRCHDCVVVVSMSPPSIDQNCNLTLSNVISATEEENENEHIQEEDTTRTNDRTTTDNEDESGLIPIRHRGPISIASVSTRGTHKRSRIMHLLQERSGLSLFMTGFASDTQYLARCAAGHVSQEEQVYAGKHMNARDLMRDALAPRLQSATLSGGSRPFGVQVLAISPGTSAATNTSVNTSGSRRGEKGSPMIMTTLDPSGNLRYWHGMGACIGKDSNLIKKHLHQLLQQKAATKSTTTTDLEHQETWRDALDVCIKALLETAEESQNLRVTPSEEIISELDAVVIFDRCGRGKGRGYSCARIDQKVLVDSFDKCYSSMSNKNAKAKA